MSDSELITSILSDGQWRFARTIADHPAWLREHPGMFAGESDRVIRQVASDSRGTILSYPGSPGYKLRIHATDAEVLTAVAKLRHQGNEMLRRAAQIESVFVNVEQLELV